MANGTFPNDDNGRNSILVDPLVPVKRLLNDGIDVTVKDVHGKMAHEYIENLYSDKGEKERLNIKALQDARRKN